MLTLAILRHAKSSWDDPAEDDFVRPLNGRGRKAAPEAGAALKKLGATPTRILCSPAKRTRETLDLALPEMHLKGIPQVTFDERLYLATASDLLECIRETGAGSTSLLIIGHNPGLHALAHSLAGTGDIETLKRLAEKYPTAAIALLEFETDNWRHVRQGTGHLRVFWTPKEGFGDKD